MGAMIDDCATAPFGDISLQNVKIRYDVVLARLAAKHPSLESIGRRYAKRMISDDHVASTIFRLLDGVNPAQGQRISMKEVIEAYTLDVDGVCPINHYDFSTTTRYTFPEDDFMHVLESPANILSDDERSAFEAGLAVSLSAHGLHAAQYWSDRNLKAAYRHLRWWDVYARGQMNARDKTHPSWHVKQAYRHLHIHCRGAEPPQEDFDALQTRGLQTLADLID
ncbi:MAG: hypothetical protein ABIH41_06245 [Nanoarchaeota archaeon]